MGTSSVIEFAWPYVFILLPLPWFVYRFLSTAKFSEDAMLKVPELSDFSFFEKHQSVSSSKWKVFLLSCIWLALLLSAARPQWIADSIELPKSGRDLMLAVDLSGSMQHQDFEMNGRRLDRLSALKLIVSDFIERRKGDRIGLILFGSEAYLQAPLTFDIATVKQLLMESAVGLAGTDTAIGDAIGLAVKQLRERPESNRVLILITDGINNSGELTPEKAAELAAHEKLKIYTIAIGSKQGAVQTIFGSRVAIGGTEIDEKALQMIAQKTGGEYFRAYNTNELTEIYKHIDAQELREQSGQVFRPIEEMYYWPLAQAFVFLGGMLSYEWIRRRR